MNIRFAVRSSLAAIALLAALGCATSSSDTASADSMYAESEQGIALGQRVDGSLKLKDESGRTVTLASLYKEQPIVLTFYRGNWCPYCVKALTEWRSRTGDLNHAGGKLVAVSLENLTELGKTQDTLNAEFTVLSDYSGKLSEFFDLTFELDTDTQKRYANYGINLAASNASGTWELPVPGTFVIDTDGVIRFVYNDPNYQIRANPEEVIRVVASID